MKTIALIAKREFLTRLLTKASLISTIVFIVVLLGAGVAVRLILHGGPATTTLGYTEQTIVLEETVTAGYLLDDPDSEIKSVTDSAETIEKKVKDGTFDYGLIGDPLQPTLVSNGVAGQTTLRVVEAAIQGYAMSDAIVQLGGNPADLANTLATAKAQVKDVSDSAAIGVNSPNFNPVTLFAAMGVLMILLMLIIGTGQLIAAGVVEEKTSRIVEILLSTVRPGQLLAGKVLGIGLLGIVSAILTIIPAIAAVYISGFGDGVSDVLAELGIWTVVWFILGYLIYGVLYTGTAALVSRQEELGTALLPLMFLQMIPFYVAVFYGVQEPNSEIIKNLSLVPFFTPYIMPLRQSFGLATPLELAIAVITSLILIPILIWFAGRLYHRGVLHMGARLKIREAFRSK